MQRGMIVDSISKALDVAVHTLLKELAWQVGESPFTNLSCVAGDLMGKGLIRLYPVLRQCP
jgi:hypothetical protein